MLFVVERDGVRAVYHGRGRWDGHKLTASLDGAGNVDMVFQAESRSAKRRIPCSRRRDAVVVGTFTGRLEFADPSGLGQFESSSARPIYFADAASIVRRGGRGTVFSAADVVSLSPRQFGAAVSGPNAKPLYLASVGGSERGFDYIISVRLMGGADTIQFSPSGDGVEVHPPAPFYGWGRYLASEETAWSGTLGLRLPNGHRFRLAGPTFTASIREGEGLSICQ